MHLFLFLFRVIYKYFPLDEKGNAYKGVLNNYFLE